MTSRIKWPLLAAILLVIGLLLVACERPLPSDGSGDDPEPATTADTDSGAYPGPEADEGDLNAPEPGDAESSYPPPETELVQPLDEEPVVDAGYPAEEGGTAADDAAAEESAEGEAAEGETTESEGSEGEAAASETTEGEAGADEADSGETAAGETTESEGSEGETAASEPLERTHTVGAGDTLYSIGLQYNMSWVAIAEANDITNPDSLYIGQELIIPDLTAESITEDTTETSADSEEEATAETPESGEQEEASEVIHVVQSGENLYRISIKYGVNMMDVARANGLANFDTLAVGQELIIPNVEAQEEEGGESQTEEVQTEDTTHVVLEGETVFSIAFKYGIAWTKLVESNEISSPYTLETGQVLVIPAGE
ncbi:MAG: LysM peptidoglycan-binding domain-containing protein [Candidatus Promineifilaceae bacterium]|nr:LysM peptidoglycan-binding domain-containing protein [Candidatus Promineifilaceae bacterium]